MSNLLLPLLPAKWRPYAKSVLAALGAILTAVSLYADAPDWVAGAIGIGTALGVWAQPNADKPDAPGRHEA